MAMQIGMGFGKFLARVLFQELGVSVPSSVFHVLFITRSLHAYCRIRSIRYYPLQDGAYTRGVAAGWVHAN